MFLRRLTCAVLFLLFLIQPYLHSQEAFVIDKYVVEMSLKEDASMLLNETIAVRFKEKKHGIIREIPLQGKFRSHSQSIKVSDIDIEGMKYTTSTSRGNKIIKIGDKSKYVNGKQEYRISFKADNGLLHFKDHEELYWTIIGPKWDTDITNANFVIHLPKAIQLSADDIQVFSGDVGENTSYGTIAQKDQNTIEGKSLTTLGKGKALTVGIKFPKGYFFESAISTEVPIEKVTEKRNWLRGLGTLPLPLLGLGALIFAFFRKGRRASSLVREITTHPPEHMTSAEVGTFYDRCANDRDLLSLLPKWGKEGLMKVKYVDDDIYLEKIEAIPRERPNYEEYLFENLFADDDLVFLDDLKYKFFSKFAKAKSMLSNGIDPGLYDDQAIKMFHGWRIILLSALALVCAAIFIYFGHIITAIGFVIFGLIAFITRFVTPKKSDRGERLHNRLINFKRTLSSMNDQQLSDLTDEDLGYIEKVYPYIVAFGIDEEFTKLLSSLSIKPPDWYYSEGEEQVGYNDIGYSKMQSSMTTPPVADSSSSSFGGGSSGGGFSGGGGSSW